MKKLNILVLTVLFSLLINSPVFAYEYVEAPPAYLKLTSPNQSVVDNPLWSYQDYWEPSPFMSVYIAYKLQIGDSCGVRWYDIDDNYLGESRIVATSDHYDSGGMIEQPEGAYKARLFLESGSEMGVRYVWYTEAQNQLLNMVEFQWPFTDDYIFGGDGGDPGGGDPGGGEATNDDIIDAIRDQTDDLGSTLYQIRNSINSLTGQLNDIYDQVYNMSDRLDTISGQLNSISTHLQTITNHLNTVTGQLNTLNNTVNNMNNTLTSINDYLTTPRNAGVVNTNKLDPVPTFDPTPPEINDSAPDPYVYDKPIPQMPDFIDSPGPLPRNPDPIVMAHDNPIDQEDPVGLDEPISVEDAYGLDNPLNPEEPLSRENPVLDEPLPVDPVVIDAPLPRDPFIMDAPLQRDPVSMDQPITPQNPLSPTTPFSPQAPFTPEPPLNP